MKKKAKPTAEDLALHVLGGGKVCTVCKTWDGDEPEFEAFYKAGKLCASCYRSWSRHFNKACDKWRAGFNKQHRSIISISATYTGWKSRRCQRISGQ